MPGLESVDLDSEFFIDNANESVADNAADVASDQADYESRYDAVFNSDGSVTYPRYDEMIREKDGDPEEFKIRTVYASDYQLRERTPVRDANNNDFAFYSVLAQQLCGVNGLVFNRITPYDIKAICDLVRHLVERAIVLPQKPESAGDGKTRLKLAHAPRPRTQAEQLHYKGEAVPHPDSVTIVADMTVGMMVESEKIEGGHVYQMGSMIEIMTDLSIEQVWQLDLRDFFSIHLDVSSRKKKRGRTKKKTANLAVSKKS